MNKTGMSNKSSLNGLIEKLTKYLSTDLEESAKSYGAIKRKRGIKNSIELLQMLLIYATSKISLSMLALCSNSLKISTISDTAWRKKLIGSEQWLKYLLNNLLPSVKINKNTLSKNRNIYLIDSSTIRQEKNSEYRIHMSYSLNTGCMNEINVTDKYTAESFKHYNINANDIFIADAGYAKPSYYEDIVSKKADVIFRISPNNIAILDHNGEKIDMVARLKTKKDILDINCFFR